jgi:hypothetical protein
MTDARSKQPDKLDVDLKRLGIGDPYVAIIESWTYFGIKNEDVFPRELTVRFQAGGFAEAVAKGRTLAETLKIAHDIYETNVRLVCEERRFDAMAKADNPRKPADFSDKAPTAKPVDLGFPFQHRVRDWVLACFGEVIAADVTERNHRFLEEALELVQAKGCTVSEARQLVEYVFARPAGDPNQEVGGVLVTLAALCEPSGIDMVQAGEAELARVWTKVEAIRAKQAAKPKHSPLPAVLDVPADVRRLVLAARDAIAFGFGEGREEVRELEAAADAFADRIDDVPEDVS